LWNRFTPAAKYFGRPNYNSDYLCLVPTNPLPWSNWNSLPRRSNKEDPVWDGVVIFVTSDDDVIKYIENYYVGAIVYPFGMALGFSLFVAAIFVIFKGRKIGKKKDGGEQS